MFSPPDYVSLAGLWKEFLQEFRLPLTHMSFEKYGGDDFALGDRFGSPDDFCEDAFLSTFNTMSVFAANPDGHVMRLETVLDGGRSKLFQKMSALESYFAASNPEEAGDENFWLRKLGSDDFEPWDTASQTISEWKAKYIGTSDALPSKVCFHTLPFVFERGRYVIPSDAPPWLSDVLDDHFLPDVIERFRGRSLCLDLQGAKRWRSDVMQKQSFLGSLEGPARVKPKRGRPAKKECIKVAYRKLYPDGHVGALKMVGAKIEARLGFEISTKTLSRALSEIKSEADKNSKK